MALSVSSDTLCALMHLENAQDFCLGLFGSDRARALRSRQWHLGTNWHERALFLAEQGLKSGIACYGGARSDGLTVN